MIYNPQCIHIYLEKYINQDEYFKDFKIKHFTFLPINKLNLNPQFFIHPESSTPKQNVFMITWEGYINLGINYRRG